MEQPQRSGLSDNEVYICFDSHNVFLYLGRTCDPYYLNELFEVEDIRSLSLNRNEETMFAADRLAASSYLTNLYSLIN